MTDYEWDIPLSFKDGMRVPGRVFASKKLLDAMEGQVFDQITNVATLPGILKRSYCMPDGHSGYGFSIGGVAGMDVENGGVISPGGVGFDINCLAGDTLVLTEHGFHQSISEMQESESALRCMRFSKKREETTTVVAFLKQYTKRKVLLVKTRAGNEIKATEDHPFWTPSGMKDAGALLAGSRIAVYPFEGVPYEAPSDEIVLSEDGVLSLNVPCNKLAIVKELKKRGLLPLRLNAQQTPYLAKLVAFNMGDGTLVYSSGAGQAWFYGRREDLEHVRQDVKKVGFTPSKVYSRERKHRIQTRYGEVKFEFTEHSMRVTSRAFVALLHALGAPLGNKARQAYGVPEWIQRAPLWHKRLFLAAYFGAEMSSPKTLTDAHYNFYLPAVSVNKTRKHVASGHAFLNQIAELLRQFGVETKEVSEREEYLNRDGQYSHRVRLLVDGKYESLKALYSRVGFEYHEEKKALANAAAQYLSLKEKIVQDRIMVQQQAVRLHADGLGPKAIYAALKPTSANFRFVARSVYEERKTRPRVASAFQTFNEFLRETTRGLGRSGMVWDEVESIQEIPFAEPVYDFTVAHSNHNFIANNFVVSNCGMRLCATNLTEKDVKPKLKQLVDALFERVPAGVGSSGFVKLDATGFKKAVEGGAAWAVEQGYGWEEDLRRTEENGRMETDLSTISPRAIARGKTQIGTLGSGNHYLEIQVVKPENVFDEKAAKAYGITIPEQVVVMFHCGSRGFGHQIATDYLEKFLAVMEPKYHIKILDRELACAPFHSPEGQAYFSAMKGAVNMSFANRQVILHRIREAFSAVFKQDAESLGIHQVYDVTHNTAKLEEYEVEGKRTKVLVHRKGATRALGPDHPDTPKEYRGVGQPVIIGGSMETGSYLLAGTKGAEEKTFGSTAHGSGRTMSRAKARELFRGEKLQQDMEKRGILVKTVSYSGLAEEAGGAYKDIDEVIRSAHEAGISKRVVKLVPIGNVKG